MYNPEEKDLDLVREYEPDYFSLFSRYHISPRGVPMRYFSNIAAQHRKSLFESGVKCKVFCYGPFEALTVDVFYKEGNDCKPPPLFAFIHGCKFEEADKVTSVSMVAPLVKNGYRVALFNYINGEEEENIVKRFNHWLFKYAERAQITDVHIAGHSKGAFLMAFMLHTADYLPEWCRSKLKSLFLLCGYYDFREMVLVHPDKLLTVDENIVKEKSSITWCWKGDSEKWSNVKIHVLTVEHTSVTLQEQSRQFSQVLEAAGFNSSFKQFDGLDHYTILLDQNVESSEITKYIKTAMQKASSGSSKGSNRPCTCASKR